MIKEIINEMKACLFRIKHERTFLTVYGMVLLTIVAMYCFPIISEDAATVIESFCGELQFFMLICIIVVTAYITFLICIGDMQTGVNAASGVEAEREKLFLLTLMGGKRRLTIYTARILLSAAVSYLFSVGIVLLPIYISGMLFPIGNEIPMAEVIKRTGLLLVVVMRITCEIAMLCFLFHNVLVAFASMSFPFFATLMQGPPNFFSHVFSMHSLQVLYNFVSYETYTLRLKHVSVYTCEIKSIDIWGIVVFAIGASMFSYLVGYHYHRLEDF